MKTFIFTKSYSKGRYTVKVYQVKRNVPQYVGEREYNSSYYSGHDHEAMQVITNKKKLPKNCMTKDGYIDEFKRNKVFKLLEVY